jgi:hypothetical protein
MVVLLTSTHYSVRTIRRFFETDQCSVMNVEQSWFHLNELSQAVPIKSTACVFYSPLIILDEAVENDVASFAIREIPKEVQSSKIVQFNEK